ncbi:MAG TPA: serine hydrolase domain-containing protein [Verrucomicrobiae bacterium]|jgi:N-acyl-D-amino-acid deacylase
MKTTANHTCLRAVNRRKFLSSTTAGIFSFSVGRAFSASSSRVSIEEAFDREMYAFMGPRKTPGGALAVVKDRKLVYAKGYYWADRDKHEFVKPESLFRIASISKPFTAVAILQLVEKGKLNLEVPAFALLPKNLCQSGMNASDERIAKITVRHLLQHTGGWDRDKSYDPMFRCKTISEKLGIPSPPSAKDIICYMLGEPLDFDPGTRYAYSNFGYDVLGRIIEKVSGQSYEDYVRQHVLAPVGIRRMRIGQSRQSIAGEVKYYTPDDSTTRSVFDNSTVPWPYGGFHLEAMDAHGAWIASAVDLARFAAALDDAASSPLLRSSSFQTMYARPEPPVARDNEGNPMPTYYACGWNVRPVGRAGKANYWHNGSLPGTSTLLVRRWDGLSWAALFNQRSEDKSLPDSAIDGAMHRAADSVAKWPDHNLFAEIKA